MKPTLCVLWLALAGAACTRPDASHAPVAALASRALDGGTALWCSDGGTCVPVEPAPRMQDACPDSRWVGVTPQGAQACPLPASGTGGQWATSRLFDASRGTWALPPGLARYCTYDWQPASAGAPPEVGLLAALEGEQRLVGLDPDCHTVAPLGTSAGLQAAWETLRTGFHAQTGRLASLPSDSAHVPEHVRVAVVDSTPPGYSGGEARGGRLRHGYVVGRLVRELGCPEEDIAGAPCVAQVANHLALPQLTPTTRDFVHGGYFGQQTQLAQAIHNALSDWRSHQAYVVPSQPAQRRLVVNLSVAWEGRYGGPFSGDPALALPAPAAAVYAALVDAACRGALVLASAGNDPGGPQAVSGPMYPAGWEMKQAPSSSQCEAFEGTGYLDAWSLPVFAQGPVYRPLLYAVGGVRGDDRRLASTRPGGRPRVAAPGSHALAWDAYSGLWQPTDVLTGTSASAAVGSGIAATVWGYRPLLTPPEVMAVVRRASVDLGVEADFCLGGRPCTWGSTAAERSIRRVSLCQAVREACATGAEHCPASAASLSCDAGPAGRPQLDASQHAAIDTHLKLLRPDGGPWSVPLDPLELCQHASLRSGEPAYSEVVCPFRQLSGAPLRPWTGPQPRENPCTVCDVTLESTTEADGGTTLSATLYAGIDSDFAGHTLSSPTLLINGQHEVQLSGLPTLTGGSEAKVSNISLDPAWLPVQSAVLNLMGQEDGGTPYSTMSELLVR